MIDKIKLAREIAQAKEIIKYVNENRDIGKFKFQRPYLHSNEGDFYKSLDLQGKDVATVGSSCDQMLYSLLYGANSVTLFDVNPFVYHYFQLKSAAIQNLSMRQTKSLFTIHPIDATKDFAKVVEKLSSSMPKESAIFWKEIGQSFSHQEIIEGFFDKFGARYPAFMQSKSDYLALRDVLKSNPQINFVQSSLHNLPTALPSGATFDVALLSNVADYYTDKGAFKTDVQGLLPFMKKGGVMQVNYAYKYPKVFNHQKHPNKLEDIESLFGVRAINGTIFPHVRDVLPAPLRTNGSFAPAVLKENSILINTDDLKQSFTSAEILKEDTVIGCEDNREETAVSFAPLQPTVETSKPLPQSLKQDENASLVLPKVDGSTNEFLP